MTELRDAPYTAANGAAPSPAPFTADTPAVLLASASSSGPRMPRREATVTIPGYEGFEARVWVNYPKRLQDDLRSGDTDRLESALRQIIVSHNNWCDQDGQPLPQPSEEAFWKTIPDELAAALIALVNQESGKLPNSILARRTP